MTEKRGTMKKKLGILTFHHVTNYGAVLQCYALQTYLQRQGFETEVINYKPRKQEDTLYNFFRFRKFKDLASYCLTRKREQQLRKFRAERLAVSPVTLRTMAEVQRYVDRFDIIVSGSDQVLNPSSLLYSEAYGGKGSVCPVYFLGFSFTGRKYGYALSFGVTQYPEPQLSIARKYIRSFDKLSVRENTGVNIVETMGRNDAIVVPDPTFLQESSFYHELADAAGGAHKGAYTYSFFIRDVKATRSKMEELRMEKTVLWNNDDGEYSLEGWLNKIRNAAFVITDSFHCMVMCLKLHTPFAVITKLAGKNGMNDRFYTILEKLGMEERIIYQEDMQLLVALMDSPNAIDWETLDGILAQYAQEGISFLNESSTPDHKKDEQAMFGQ